MTTLQAISPIDQRPLGAYTVTPLDAIPQQLADARVAGQIWAAVSVKQRGQILGKLKNLLVSDLDGICQLISQTNGKVTTDALLGDVFPLLTHLEYYAKHAPRILAEQAVFTSPFAYPAATACIQHKPYGVVAVIAPWNYPLQLTLLPVLTALWAGNAVLFKVSELSLPIGQLIVDLLAQLDLPAGLVQQVIGERAQGETMIDAGPDLVFFTGGLAAGRAVMQRAAQHPIPVLLELGGKDAMIVFDDADLPRAVNAALYGAFNNSGQVCVAVERLYVQRSIHDAFLQQLIATTSQLNVSLDGDIGAMTSERQFQHIQAQYDDAIAQGAQASGPLLREGNFVKPVVLWHVHHGMKLMQQETFGPLLPVMAFDSEAEAVQLANDSAFGLNASVWSRDIPKAEHVARQLQVGNWAVNDVVKNIGHPALPFGGVKHSGFGRYHGAQGLLSFSYAVSGMTSRSKLDREANWFPYGPAHYQALCGFFDYLFGNGHSGQRFWRNRAALWMFRRYAALDVRQMWHNAFAWLRR